MSRPRARQLVIIVAGGALWAACGSRPVDRSPVGVVKRLIVAAQDRDTRALYALLGPATQARLKASAGRATALAGGSPKRQPHEMLSPAWRSGALADWTPKTFKLLKKTAQTAVVEIRGEKKGQRAELTLVKTAGRWRVEFGQPPLPGRSPPAPGPSPR